MVKVEAFHFGTDLHKGKRNAASVLVLQSFPYQELRLSVLLWHATCIKRGQKTQETRNWEQGHEAWHRQLPQATGCWMLLTGPCFLTTDRSS